MVLDTRKPFLIILTALSLLSAIQCYVGGDVLSGIYWMIFTFICFIAAR